LLQAARYGVTTTSLDGEVIGRESAAVVRAGLLRQHRVHERALLDGLDCDEPVEAEAGAILEAELAVDIHDLADIARQWAKGSV
jgi:hypothetical protein